MENHTEILEIFSEKGNTLFTVYQDNTLIVAILYPVDQETILIFTPKVFFVSVCLTNIIW